MNGKDAILCCLLLVLVLHADPALAASTPPPEVVAPEEYFAPTPAVADSAAQEGAAASEVTNAEAKGGGEDAKRPNMDGEPDAASDLTWTVSPPPPQVDLSTDRSSLSPSVHRRCAMSAVSPDLGLTFPQEGSASAAVVEVCELGLRVDQYDIPTYPSYHLEACHYTSKGCSILTRKQPPPPSPVAVAGDPLASPAAGDPSWPDPPLGDAQPASSTTGDRPSRTRLPPRLAGALPPRGISSDGRVAALPDSHGPCVGVLWVCPWYFNCDAGRDDTMVYRRCSRSEQDRLESLRLYGGNGNGVGSHVQMHVLVLNNHDAATGPWRWIDVEEFDMFHTLTVEEEYQNVALFYMTGMFFTGML
nr:unnamed protein product [Digitaria exilis]CAB3503631.1 unnamed protein product [Digitaria exilis]CAB3503638.1 unnamed protein product [Digitaria exilis]